MDMDWAREQLALAGIGQSETTSILRLLEVWRTMNFSAGTSPDTVLTGFVELARGHALKADEEDSESGRTWVKAPLVRPLQGDYVRVRRDALSGDRGRRLNGKRGRLSRISRGVLVVNIDGASGVEHFSLSDIEVLR